MCNEFQQRIAWQAYCDLMASLDVAPIHERQIVLVPPARFGDWLYRADASVLAPALAGSLKVDLIRRGKDWPPEEA